MADKIIVSYLQLAYLHLTTVLPAFAVGTYLIFARKGSPTHRLLGKLFIAFIMVTAIISLFMPAQVGPKFLGHFGFIHLLSLNVIYSAPTAYLAARQGNIKKHKTYMMGLYVFGLVVAGTFALMPGRLLHGWIFG